MSFKQLIIDSPSCEVEYVSLYEESCIVELIRILSCELYRCPEATAANVEHDNQESVAWADRTLRIFERLKLQYHCTQHLTVTGQITVKYVAIWLCWRWCDRGVRSHSFGSNEDPLQDTWFWNISVVSDSTIKPAALAKMHQEMNERHWKTAAYEMLLNNVLKGIEDDHTWRSSKEWTREAKLWTLSWSHYTMTKKQSITERC